VAVDKTTPYSREFGARMREARMAAEATQAELARALGLTRSSVANIEAGRQHVLAELAVSVAGLLRVDPLWLLVGTQVLGRPQPPQPGVKPAALQRVADELDLLSKHLRELSARASAPINEGNTHG
jgi:transcriptional regulator with XRE-family HTH domain